MKIINFVHEKLKNVFGDKQYHLIAVAITGSHAYGINTKDSDIDIMGIFLPPEEYILRVKHIEQIEFSKKENEYEGMLFSFSKWYNLMLQQNPNVLELLWHIDNMYVYRDNEYWPKLFNLRKEFLSKKLKHSYGGYAFAQSQRLKRLNIKVNQNTKRLENFDKFGYDVKAASHIFRLLGSALDGLVEHEINVLRPDRQFLLAIREGKYTYEEISNMALEKNKLIEEAYVRSTLRNSIDMKLADILHIDILKNWLKNF